MRRSARRGARSTLGAVALSLVLVTAACGDDDDDTSGDGGDSSGSADAALGPVDEATGEPVKIGWVSDGQTQAIDTSGEIRMAQAVVDYANEHLGGLNGRPIELVTCETGSSPSGGQECGNTFVNEGVVAVSAAVPSQIDAVISVVSPAGIPVGVQSGSSGPVLQSPNVFVWSNPLSVFGAPAAYAQENDIDSAAIIVIDVPGASGPARQLSPVFFGNAGSSANVVTIPPGTADMTPQIQAAQNEDPGMFYIVGDPTFCSSALRAIETLAITTPVLTLDRCVGEDGGASIPGGYEGVTMVTGSVANEDDPEYQTYKAVIETYGNDVTDSAESISAYQGMLGLIRAVNAAAPAELTPATVGEAIASMPPTPYPLGGGAEYQCNGEALPAISPNICSTFAALADASADGTLSNFRPVEGEDLYQLPTG